MLHAGLVGSRRRMAILTGEHLVVVCIGVAINAHIGGCAMRKPELSVVEDRAQPRLRRPGGSGVAGLASRRVGGSYVIRHGCSVGLRVCIVSLMATVAIRRRKARRIVPAGVAVRTRIDHWPDRTRNCRARRQHVRA